MRRNLQGFRDVISCHVGKERNEIDGLCQRMNDFYYMLRDSLASLLKGNSIMTCFVFVVDCSNRLRDVVRDCYQYSSFEYTLCITTFAPGLVKHGSQTCPGNPTHDSTFLTLSLLYCRSRSPLIRLLPLPLVLWTFRSCGVCPSIFLHQIGLRNGKAVECR